MQKSMTVRICDHCKKPLKFQPDGTQEGIIWDERYYHEGECIEANTFDDMTWEEQYDFLGGDDQDTAYWTEWEPEFEEQA